MAIFQITWQASYDQWNQWFNCDYPQKRIPHLIEHLNVTLQMIARKHLSTLYSTYRVRVWGHVWWLFLPFLRPEQSLHLVSRDWWTLEAWGASIKKLEQFYCHLQFHLPWGWPASERQWYLMAKSNYNVFILWLYVKLKSWDYY